jgi:uncharacterized membrane protein YhaH (DUF805 family)
MKFIESISFCLSNYKDFSGRASRSEFFYFLTFCTVYFYIVLFLILFVVLPYLPYWLFDFVWNFNSNMPGTIVISILLIPVVLPLVSVTTRRLNDFNRPGWVQILFYGGFFLAELIYWPNTLPTFILITLYLYYFSRKSVK